MGHIDNIEHFKQSNARDVCHFTCSSINYINVIVLFLILVILYNLFFTKQQ